MKPVKEYTFKGQTLQIFQDEYCEQPFQDTESCFLIHKHRDFTVEVKGVDINDVYKHFTKGKNIKLQGEMFRIYPVYAYIHSGIALSLGKDTYPFTCKFDTSFAGFVLVKIAKGWSYRKQTL